MVLLLLLFLLLLLLLIGDGGRRRCAVAPLCEAEVLELLEDLVVQRAQVHRVARSQVD